MLSTNSLSLPFISHLFNSIENNEFQNTNLQNKILINAFFEPSTRTSLSFESAMYKMNGNVITFHQEYSSVKKGESFKDTIKTLASYGDILVIRHPDVDKVREAQSYVNVPIINGGNGNGEHPTQALLDLYTIHKHLKEKKINHPIARLNNDYQTTCKINILFIGDIMNSRTIHSLFSLLIQYDYIHIHFLPFCDCDPPVDIISKIINYKFYDETIIFTKDNIDLSIYDVIYVTRMQKERTNKNNNPDVIVDKEFMKKVKQDAIIMHPLPRNEEIVPEIDDDPRCVYFKQMENGLKVRMALLNHFLSN